MLCDDIWSIIILYTDMYTINKLIRVSKRMLELNIDYRAQFLFYFQNKLEKYQPSKENLISIFQKNKLMMPIIINEIVTTQQTLVNSIHDISVDFFEPIQKNKIITNEEFNQIYTPTIDGMIKIQQEILILFSRDEKSLDNILNTFDLIISSLIILYKKYIQNMEYETVRDRHTDLVKKYKKYADLTIKCKYSGTVEYLLACFNGRLPRFNLLFREFVSHCTDPRKRIEIEKIRQKFEFL
eukprot:gene9033-1131_t